MNVARVAILEAFAPETQGRIRGLAGPRLSIGFAESDNLEDRARALDGAQYAVVRSVKMPADLLDRAPDLRMIHQWGTGTDGIPLSEAAARGIVVARSPGLNAPSVADLALALMLTCLRRVVVGDRLIRGGAWAEPDLYEIGRDLTGARVGLLGYGAIAAEVAKRLRGFDCEVVYHRPSGPVPGLPGYLPFDDFISDLDVLSLHAPSTAATRKIIDAGRIAAMRRGTVIVNTARGELVDEAALAAGLHAGQIGAAGLDVFDPEPLAAESPLRSAPNTVFSAHSGGRTRENFARIVRHWAGNIRRHADGLPIEAPCLVALP
ncbi:MAG: hydroxyacid dehydrogenase [Rhodobacteraceae bacterium]|nr:hydroxyacid dehydrogenase [Paracoccaceae bacterium]